MHGITTARGWRSDACGVRHGVLSIDDVSETYCGLETTLVEGASRQVLCLPCVLVHAEAQRNTSPR